jgi:hypothetical protein
VEKALPFTFRVGKLRVKASDLAPATVTEAAPPEVAASATAALPIERAEVSWTRRILPHVIALVAFTAVTVVATWPMLPNLGGYVISKLDPLYSVWALGWQGHALATTPLGLLDANIMYPFKGTLAFDELAFAEAVMAAPVYWLTGNPVLSHNSLWMLTFILSGYGMWLLVRELTGSFAAGLVAGAAYAFSFYRLDHIPHLTLLSAEWLPLLLLAAYKLLWVGSWRWAFALGGLFALQALSSHYLAFFAAILLGLFFVYYALVDRRLVSWPLVGKLAVGLGAALLVMVPIVVPYVSVQAGAEFSRDLFQVERYSNTLASFLSVYEGHPLYKALLAPFADPGPWPWERAAFPGLAVLVLSVVAVVGAWRIRRTSIEWDSRHDLRKHVGFFVIVVVLSAFLSLGPTLQITYPASDYDPNAINGVIPLPYTLLHEWVPGFQSMRGVARIGVLTSLGLSALAGIGAFFVLVWLRQTAGTRQWGRWAIPAVIVVLALLPVVESWSAPLYMEPIGTRGAVPQVYRWLGAQPHTVVAEYPMTYYKPGLDRVELANTIQYYSLYHFQDLVNGSTTIRPYAYSALVHETEDCFPCPRSLDALWALGVEYVVVHLDQLSGPQREDFLWRTSHPEGGVLGDIELVQQFGPDQVYRIKGPRDVGQLAELIPEGASLLLAKPDLDPIKVGNSQSFIGGGYVAALGHYLRSHPQYGDPRLSFGQKITEPNPDDLPEYALLWTRQDPLTAGYLPENRIWANDVVALYKKGPERAQRTTDDGRQTTDDANSAIRFSRLDFRTINHRRLSSVVCRPAQPGPHSL